MTNIKSCLFLSGSQVVSGTTLKQFAASEGVTIDSINIVTQSSHIAAAALSSYRSSFDTILSVSDVPSHHSPEFLSHIIEALKPGGSLLLQEPVAQRLITPEEAAKVGPPAASLPTQASIQRSLLVAGFTEAAVTSPVVELGLAPSWMGITPASVGSTRGALFHPLSMRAQKPKWEVGSSFSLKKRGFVSTTAAVKGSEPEATNAEATGGAPNGAAAPSPRAWKLDAAMGGIDDEDEDEFVDEESLLTEEDLAPPAAVPAADSCATSKKACANCVCGRAEMEEEGRAVKLSVDQVDNPQSACGSCGLGDAFRCAGCPYRGLPTFKLGEKISLSTALLTADT